MKKLRSWVTPVTSGSFLLIGVTGALMFFKVHGGLIVIAHEWLSPVFLIGACLHIWLNWSAVYAHLTRVRGMVVVGLFAVLLLLSLVPLDEVSEVVREHGHGQEVAQKAAEVLLEARISTVAELTGRTPQQLRDILGRHDIRFVSDELTLAGVARQGHVHPTHLLAEMLPDR